MKRAADGPLVRQAYLASSDCCMEGATTETTIFGPPCRPHSGMAPTPEARTNYERNQASMKISRKRGKTPGTQVQQSRIPDGQMTVFCHCCVGESRIDPLTVRDCPGFCLSYDFSGVVFPAPPQSRSAMTHLLRSRHPAKCETGLNQAMSGSLNF
jgi:hypothetical protein